MLTNHYILPIALLSASAVFFAMSVNSVINNHKQHVANSELTRLKAKIALRCQRYNKTVTQLAKCKAELLKQAQKRI